MMPFKLTLFATDILVYLLVMSTTLFFFWARKNAFWSNAWRKLTHNRSAVITITILFFYMLVAFLDSIHFQTALPATKGQPVFYSPEIKSVFDVLIRPVGQRVEKTYSAPFASHLYNRDIIQLSNGKFVQTYIPLVNAATAFSNSGHSKRYDIVMRSASGIWRATVVWLVIVGIIYLWQRICKTDSVDKKSRHTFLITLAVVLSVIFMMHALSQAYYIFGTDKVGQDVFYVCLKSIRTGVLIGTLTTLVMLPFAILLGMTAGYFGGLIDDIIQYIYTTLSSIPAVLLIAASILSIQIFIANHPALFRNLATQADARLLALCIILGITSWTSLCRLLRAETLKLREMDYISAAKVLGVPHFSILIRHILPNVMHIVIITVVLDFSGLVLAEAVLSYVGIGVDPTMMSWGNMINSARLELAREPIVWWPLLSAFIFMFILVLCANIFSDRLRDAFDPKWRLD